MAYHHEIVEVISCRLQIVCVFVMTLSRVNFFYLWYFRNLKFEAIFLVTPQNNVSDRYILISTGKKLNTKCDIRQWHNLHAKLNTTRSECSFI